MIEKLPGEPVLVANSSQTRPSGPEQVLQKQLRGAADPMPQAEGRETQGLDVS